MTDFLIRHLIKDYNNVEKSSVRTAYSMLSGAVGVFLNTVLFAAKLVSGLVLHSVSVMADAFNNLSDALSSVISLYGARAAAKPADREHPFGHGRAEYVAALVIAFLIMEVGLSFLESSIEKIRTPEELNFRAATIIVLLLSIAAKLWLGFFNRKLGRRIESQVLKAVFTDSLGDALTTSAALLSLLIYRFTGLNIDGITGACVSLVVLWAGFSIAKDTVNTLIGEPPDPAMCEKIRQFALSYEGVEGVHDLIVHNYGPGQNMATIHVEMEGDQELEAAHEIVERMERDARDTLGVSLLVHMDPAAAQDERVQELKQKTEAVLSELDPACSMHDFHVLKPADEKEKTQLFFDLRIPVEYSEQKRNEIPLQLMERMKGADSRCECVITVDWGYRTENVAQA